MSLWNGILWILNEVPSVEYICVLKWVLWTYGEARKYKENFKGIAVVSSSSKNDEIY